VPFSRAFAQPLEHPHLPMRGHHRIRCDDGDAAAFRLRTPPQIHERVPLSYPISVPLQRGVVAALGERLPMSGPGLLRGAHRGLQKTAGDRYILIGARQSRLRGLELSLAEREQRSGTKAKGHDGPGAVTACSAASVSG
jgi:hypothetical protein